MFSYDRRTLRILMLILVVVVAASLALFARGRSDEWTPTRKVATVADIEAQHNTSLITPTPTVPGPSPLLIAAVTFLAALGWRLKR